ncbi:MULTISPECIES: DUF2225 domain-containing protein [unclassified Thermotoga]|uniref:DUF2225 domain-containing protein n=1 Tax=unclassified Thermotoga TaxID=2631113 RepID=UPI0005430399|nr:MULTISPECIES: DUF2225 domain-containing protein [unclassified Thermotoga]KAF2959932.1 hypothetical protein AS158_05675 [Thermotoga sp. 38H-to]KHC90416.1 hypothetical protein Mc24_08649 [Thermotoga sp. Mc24]
MSKFWEKEFTCPFCGTKFKKKMVFFDSIKIKARDIDLKPVFEDVNPMFYEVVTCPNCYFSAFDKDFETITIKGEETERKLKELLEEAQRKVELKNMENHTEAIKRYALSGIVYSVLNQRKKVAISYLKIAWLFRELGKAEEEKRYLERALKEFESHYKYDYYEESDEPMILFYLGVLNQILGKRKEAARWYELLLRKYDSKSLYAKVGRERWLELRRS